jgi:hypothetical protein
MITSLDGTKEIDEDKWMQLYEDGEDEAFEYVDFSTAKRITDEEEYKLVIVTKKPTRNFLLNQAAGLQNQRINGILKL